ncbi:MAG TPA: hypothetical protein VGO45_03760 [Bacteroidia bacterium]|jgi:hypothetical protein|nr:hypothetical protein [Bacteroidia bacterium]
MKKITFIFCTLMLYVVSTYAQYTAKDVFTKDEIVWYGLDFSKAKFVGALDKNGKITGNEVKTKWMPAWNSLVVNEPQNFDFKKAMDKASVYYDMKPVEEVNSKIVTDNIMTLNAVKLSKEEAMKAIAAYGPGEKKEGIGLVFVVESFDKPADRGNFWVVFFDIQTKKVLFAEHAEGKGVGVGIRNFWGGSVKGAIKDIDRNLYGQWKTKYK